MKIRNRTMVKKALSKFLPDSKKIQYLSYLPKLETWRKKHDKKLHYFNSRLNLYKFINDEIIQNSAIDYLEFGVFKGESIKYWTQLNTNIETRFFGFDTFTGLPEKWNNFTGEHKKNFLDVNGKTPEIHDNRVYFIKGLFQDTLSDFLDQTVLSDKIIIHLDPDLYSATLYVLTKMDKFINNGCIILFDEFSVVLDEFRALEDYCSSYLKKYDVLGATVSSDNYFNQIAIQIE